MTRYLTLLLVLILGLPVQAKPATHWIVIQRTAGHMPSILIPKEPVALGAATNTPTSTGSLDIAVQHMAETFARDVLAIPSTTILADVRRSVAGNTSDFVFAAMTNAIPIRDAHLNLTIGEINHSVIAVRNSIPAYPPDADSPSISAVDAMRIATNNVVEAFIADSDAPQVYVRNDARHVLELCYEIRGSDAAHQSWRITVNATTGAIVEKRLLSHFFGGKPPQPAAQTVKIEGKVHLRVPTDTLTLVPLPFIKMSNGADRIEADSLGVFTLPSAASSPLNIELVNRYIQVHNGGNGAVNAKATVILPLSGSKVFFDDSNSDIAERDAFHSVNAARTFIRRLDPTLIRLDDLLEVTVNYPSTCNAFYDPGTVSLTFFAASASCVNTAEIADVVQHEFGHRCQHAVFSSVYGNDSDIVNSSLGEGFADLYTAFMRDDPRIGIGFRGNGTELRTCDNTLKWPYDLSLDPHQNGSIIAGAYWDLRKTIGLDSTLHLFQRMMWHVPDAPDVFSNQALLEAYVNTLIATLIADDNDNNLSNGTPHDQNILVAFAKHNIALSGLIKLNVPQLADQDTGSFPYPISISASYEAPIGAIDTNSLTLYYSTDLGKTYAHVAFAPRNTNFISLIPPQPTGTVVHYYVSARLNIGGDSIVVPANPYSFLVGFRTLFRDDCEQSSGWSTSLPTDGAITGRWELTKPVGTYYDATPPLYFVQQDTDHTPTGSVCFITGNRNATQGDGRNPSYDDVDGGATTLTTPMLSFDTLLDPVLRFWYYFSNNTGDHAGIPAWVVRLSTDGGAHWSIVQNTTQSTDGWTFETLRLSELGLIGNHLQLQFIASDFVQAVVEAGVDDVELLDLIRPSSAVPTEHSSGRLSIFPNPMVAGGLLRVTGQPKKLELFDLLSRLVGIAEGNTLAVPSNLPAGAYSLRIHSLDGSEETHSVIITK